MSVTKVEDIKGIIYCIKNNINNFYYVGQTLSHTFDENKNEWMDYGINERILKHLQKAQQKVDYPLYNDIRKYGINNFNITIEKIIESKNIELLDNFEKETINKYNSIIPKGYNLTFNTSYLNKNKKIILDYFKQEIVRSQEYIERNQRRKQITIKEIDRDTFFKNKRILNVRVNPIKEGENIKYARVIIEIENEKDFYKVQFSNKDIKNGIFRAIEYSKTLVDNPDIHPILQDIINDNDSMTYKYQKQLDTFTNQKIIKVQGKQYFHKKANNNIYILFITIENSKNKNRIMFGGKNIDIIDAYNYAKEFVNKLNISNNIISLDCLQQATAL